MKSLEITTHIGCLNCDYCPQDRLLRSYKSKDKKLTIKEFKICIDKIKRDVKIHFSGFSEPFFNSDCIKMIEYAHGRGHQIIIFTTTIGLDLHRIKQLKKYSFYKFVVHVPDKYTKFNINTWFRNIKYLEKEGIFFELLFVGDRTVNIKMFKYILSHFGDRLISQPLITRAGNVSWLGKIFKKNKVKCFENRFLQNVLLPNGDIYLCCMDYGLEYKLGNLIDQKYEDLFESKIFEELTEGFLKKKFNKIPELCKSCERLM